MVKSLYILGNGFDIHHGINSKYSDYHEWLEKNDNGTYENYVLYMILVLINGGITLNRVYRKLALII